MCSHLYKIINVVDLLFKRLEIEQLLENTILNGGLNNAYKNPQNKEFNLNNLTHPLITSTCFNHDEVKVLHEHGLYAIL
jgi:hypothetical protein